MRTLVEVVEWSHPRRYFFLEHTGPYSLVCQTFEKLKESLHSHGLKDGPEGYVAIWLDDPKAVPELELRSRASIFVEDEELPADLNEDWIPTGRYVCQQVIGDKLAQDEAWEFLYNVWIPHSGERIRSGIPGFQACVSDTKATPPDQWITEIYIALE